MGTPNKLSQQVDETGSTVQAFVQVDPNTPANQVKVNPDGSINVEIGSGAGVTGYVALTAPPAQTNAGSDTTLTFSQQVNHFQVQNNTSANVNAHYESAASAGSLVLVPGAVLREDKELLVLHLYTAAAQNINGASAGNIVVEGWL